MQDRGAGGHDRVGPIILDMGPPWCAAPTSSFPRHDVCQRGTALWNTSSDGVRAVTALVRVVVLDRGPLGVVVAVMPDATRKGQPSSCRGPYRRGRRARNVHAGADRPRGQPSPRVPAPTRTGRPRCPPLPGLGRGRSRQRRTRQVSSVCPVPAAWRW